MFKIYPLKVLTVNKSVILSVYGDKFVLTYEKYNTKCYLCNRGTPIL